MKRHKKVIREGAEDAPQALFDKGLAKLYKRVDRGLIVYMIDPYTYQIKQLTGFRKHLSKLFNEEI